MVKRKGNQRRHAVRNSPRPSAGNPRINNRRLFRQETSIVLNQTSGADVYRLGSANINLRALNAFNQAAVGYDLYRLNRVKIYLQPMYPEVSSAAQGDVAPEQFPLNTAPNTTFWCYVDPAFEGVAGTTQQTVINATNVQYKTLSINNIKLVASYRPRITQSITDQPVINAMVRGNNTWVNTQTDIIRWNAIKFYAVLAGGSAQFTNTAFIAPRLRVIVEYDVMFKIPRANITLPTLQSPPLAIEPQARASNDARSGEDGAFIIDYGEDQIDENQGDLRSRLAECNISAKEEAKL